MKRRVFYPGGLYHLFARGNNRAPIFRERADCKRFFNKTRKFVTKYRVEIFSYVFITTHIHFGCVQETEIPLSKFMQALQVSHVRYMNAKCGLVGHLFQGRFQAIEIKSEEQLLALGRYIHRNPVDAGLVKRPEDWEWSSYRAFTEGFDDGLTKTERILGPKPSVADRLRYRRFVEADEKK